MKKSESSTATEAIATVSVVALPTPSVPPPVLKPLWQPTTAMMNPKMKLLPMPELKSRIVAVSTTDR